MRCLKQRILDPHFLRLIGRFLNTGAIEEGKFIPSEEGTPQGASLSPVLSNIYLHYILDLWFERKVKSQLKGFAQLTRYAVIRNYRKIYHIQDFVLCQISLNHLNLTEEVLVGL